MDELNKSLAYFKNRLAGSAKLADEYVFAANQEHFYKIHKLRKSNGRHRFIYEPENEKLKSAHKQLHSILLQYQSMIHPCAHGFIKNRSCFTNAKQHTAKKYILNLDIKNFFDSIGIEQVKASFIELGASNELSDYLSKLTTVNGILRQGLHTSPDISNHCMKSLDIDLTKFAQTNSLNYSRYGDDITFSGDSIPEKESIISIIEAQNFVVNIDKSKLQKRGSNQYVTGLTVFDQAPRIPKKFKKYVRMKLYLMNTYGILDYVSRTEGIYRDDFESEETYEATLGTMVTYHAKCIVGQVAYINSVEPTTAKALWTILNDNDIRDLT
jgi:hypothetical protein